ncbi:TetR/AcrR family transcriptional regulator [Hamadaea flava]|uniref:TetR/AcrR family transcriptional regulator n=1 Tax=Hamadaea flava TaxID=1742688 RepID=A0ABV8LES1_9ACTN|nr:TetR/AcrR family transcriptional regulator [Hamadaea flava]
MLEAAVRVFAERGFHAATMDEVAERAGVSKPMVYAYLGTKDELFVACLRREAGRLLASVAGVVDPQLPPDEQLWRGLRGFFSYVGSNRDGWAVLFRQARTREPFAGELARMRRGMVAVIAEKLADALRSRGRDVPADELQAMALALVGAGEALADRLVDTPHEEPERTATRLMNAIWLGAERQLDGEVWKPVGEGRLTQGRLPDNETAA